MSRVNVYSSCLLLFQLLHSTSSVGAIPTDQQILQDGSHSIMKVRAELKKAEIIPTVVDDFMPYLTLNVTWPSNETAELGNTINPDDVQKIPTIQLLDDTTSDSSSSSSMTYTVALTDPDAPSRDNPEWSEICHWIATYVPVKKSSNTEPGTEAKAMKKGLKEIMPYKPPGPPPETGKHRYVFLAFAPANGTTGSLHLSKPGDRQHWGFKKERMGVRDWAEQNGLVSVAANFIYAQNDKQ